MSDEFKQYVISSYQDIPQEVYEGLLSVFCLGLVAFSAWKGFYNRTPLFSSVAAGRVYLSPVLLNSVLPYTRRYKKI